MEKKLAEYKCETNDAISLKLGTSPTCSVTHCDSCRNMFIIFACVCSSCLFAIIARLKLLHFLIVRFPEDVDDDGTTFHPEYSHQLFGDE